MRQIVRGCFLSLAFCAGAFASGSSGASGNASDAVNAADLALRAAVPGVRLSSVNPNNRMYYGKPMVSATTPEAAASLWLEHYADSWGVENPELHLVRAHDVSFGKFTVFAFEQTIDGAPVPGAWARLLVLNGDVFEVVLASAELGRPPVADARSLTVAADAAVATVRSLPAYASLPVWSTPEKVVYYNVEQGIAGVWAWRFVGEDYEIETRAMHTFFVDAISGAILEERNEILNVDVNGSVSGMASPGTLPDIASNPEASTPLSGARASISGGSFSFTTPLGTFTIPHGGSGAVTVNTGVTQGRWVSVSNTAGSNITASVGVTPPGPANLLLNASPTEFNTSQVNVLHNTNLTHDLFRDRAPGFPAGLDIVIPAYVNWDSAGGITSCNAFFDPGAVTINFFREKGGCVNSAYSTVVSHEYGHFIVQTLGLSQGAFGEGFGDTCAVLLYDTSIVGENFLLSGGHIRNIGTTTVSYPCSSAAHTCGQVIARVWLNIRNNFGSTYGSGPGLELARQLMVDWSQITGGGSGSNAAHPNTAIEVLTADDDNGDLDDGTPNYSLICAAFANRNISCPPLAAIDFVYPNGLPALVTPGQTTDVQVNVIPLAGTPTPGTGTLSYRVGGGSFTTVSMTQGAPNQYTATLPAVNCPQTIEYYFSSGSSAGTISDPADAPGSFYSATAGGALLTPYVDDMETDQGWTVGAPDDDATAGIWVRVDPVGTAAQPENDHTPGAGTHCWVTGQGAPGGGLGDADVDNGKTTLTSPAYDLSGYGSATIGYWRWYSNNTGAAPNADVFTIQVSNGGAWVTAEIVGPSGAQAAGGWYYSEFRVESLVALTSNVRVRFIAADEGAGSLVEAAVDDLTVTAIDCSVASPCPADLNGDNAVGLEDLSILLANYGSGSANPEDGDIDGDGDVDLEDLAILLAEFGSSC